MPARSPQRLSRRSLLGVGAVISAAFVASPSRAARLISDMSGTPVSIETPKRIVSIGSDVTEIIFALGKGAQVVAVDTTSQYPPEAVRLPNVGYMRALAAEGVLSMAPDLIIASAGSGPPEILSTLRQSGVPLILIDYTPSARSVLAKIAFMADMLDAKQRGAALSQSIAEQFASLEARVATLKNHPRVLFVLSLAGGAIIAAGDGSSAAEIMKLAGAENALQGFSGYKPVSAEAVIAAAPEAVIMMHSRNESVTPESLFDREPFSGLPAAEKKRLIKMDGTYLLGFGPRTPAAVADLMKALRIHAAI
ncbi:hemin ABC transporter substrate-binding protein [soil metagenome]